jgi:hypothetical protein
MTTTPANAVPSATHASALAELDAAEQRVQDAAAARERAKVATRREAALADARAAREAWGTLGAEVADWGADVPDGLVRDQHLTDALKRDVDAVLELRSLLEEEVARHEAQLGAFITELEALDPASGARRLEQLAASITAQPVELAAAGRQRVAWLLARKRAAAELYAHATIVYRMSKTTRVPTALLKQATPPEETA